MDEHERQRHEWAAPDSGAWSSATRPGPAAWGQPEPDADGPPPPPWVRKRRERRRRIVAASASAVVLLVLPLGMWAAGVFDGPSADDEVAGPTEPTPEPPAGPAPRQELEPPDPDDYSGSDADFAALLAGVESSEQSMMRFQEELAQAFQLGDGQDLTPFFAAVRSIAEASAEQLSAARDDLDDPLATPEAETVRTVYLDHLDAWLALMQAAAEDPTLFGPNGDASRFDVEINATAVDFSRTLEAELPADAADEITAYVRALLDRGFRFDGDAQA
ncbi:hypothetical protein [Egicoccus sp. AB-alg2]|uniref:hypothetical protein n=1 Tax=Egicoccus sp. AB-alg2 TaxID=3242693 RepID=UPI00359D0042